MSRRDIIVIGASAGGIEALRVLLSSLPIDLPASVFIVLHSSEDSPGLLPEVLNRSSRLPVLYAVHNMPIFPSRVYVAPSGASHLTVDRGSVRLLPGLAKTGTVHPLTHYSGRHPSPMVHALWE